MADEKTVLHVGPVNTRGGMANTIRIFSQNPPVGWLAETLATHTEGSVLAKFLCWRKARRQLITRLKQNPPDVVHIHTASDYSWWRKRRVALLCNKVGIPVIMHIHSGKFHHYCAGKKGEEVRRICNTDGIYAVTLSEYWGSKLEDWLDESITIFNPLDPELLQKDCVRLENQVLFMGRSDPIKEPELAIAAIDEARKTRPQLQLMMTGIDNSNKLSIQHSEKEWFHPLGWVDERRKMELLNESSMLLVPSRFECQPMVVIEAIHCGLPVLASPAVAETINEVYDVGSWNIKDWAEAIITPPLINNIARDKHLLNNISRQWSELYLKMVAARETE
ncbi:MAG: glycosyltransferase family 4 protein [Candidatus Poseidoniaceae archaeon]|nr:glycosyltransferase family 4 protein [Candidatus Poseidoniaceae archaeon]